MVHRFQQITEQRLHQARARAVEAASLLGASDSSSDSLQRNNSLVSHILSRKPSSSSSGYASGAATPLAGPSRNNSAAVESYAGLALAGRQRLESVGFGDWEPVAAVQPGAGALQALQAAPVAGAEGASGGGLSRLGGGHEGVGSALGQMGSYEGGAGAGLGRVGGGMQKALAMSTKLLHSRLEPGRAGSAELAGRLPQRHASDHALVGASASAISLTGRIDVRRTYSMESTALHSSVQRKASSGLGLAGRRLQQQAAAAGGAAGAAGGGGPLASKGRYELLERVKLLDLGPRSISADARL